MPARLLIERSRIRLCGRLLLPWMVLFLLVSSSGAQETPASLSQKEVAAKITELGKGVDEAKVKGDTAWMLVSSGLVMLMVPGLALFYGGMVRQKNVLATMMHSMVALAIVGVYWIAVGYCLAFGESQGGWVGWSSRLLFLAGVQPDELLPNNTIPILVHVMFQGMFAIITPALISGAVAERIRFAPYCVFILLWVTFVYCPLAHWVWAMNWFGPGATGKDMVGWLGKLGALDFAGGTVVHIAAGMSGLAACLVLRKRLGYPEHAMHPNSMVLTLTGAGLLWFGWFGFNGGSASASGGLAASAFTATQAAAAAAALSWLLVEWRHRGKPTALGLASGLVAGLVAVTPASGYIQPWAGLVIGLIAGVLCYVAVAIAKPALGYDDSLDAFGVHGVGGFLGAVLTGVFCAKVVNEAGADGLLVAGNIGQVTKQLIGAGAALVYAFGVSIVLIKMIDLCMGFAAEDSAETEGLDQTEHGETGFDLGRALEQATIVNGAEPRAAKAPPNGDKRFSVVVDGVENGELMHAWSALCQPRSEPPSPEFMAVYPHVTTVQGNRFRFRGGAPETLRADLERLLQMDLPTKSLRARVEP